MLRILVSQGVQVCDELTQYDRNERAGYWLLREQTLRESREDGSVDEQTHEELKPHRPKPLEDVRMKGYEHFAELLDDVLLCRWDRPLLSLVQRQALDAVLEERTHDLGVRDKTFVINEACKNCFEYVQEGVVELPRVYDFSLNRIVMFNEIRHALHRLRPLRSNELPKLIRSRSALTHSLLPLHQFRHVFLDPHQRPEFVDARLEE